MSPPDPPELIEIGRALIERMQTKTPIRVKTERLVNAAHLPFVHALTQHTMRLSDVALDLYERDLKIEAAPTVRLAYECSLTACWLADSKEALPAVFNEHARQRVNLAASFRESFSDALRDGAETVEPVDIEKLETIAAAQARNFRELCFALGRPDAHALYRALSTSCHATPDIADSYVDENANDPMGAHLRLEPKDIGHDSWLFMLVACMIWAARALDTMDQNRPNRDHLRELARHLNIPELLRLTQAAHAAEEKAATDRRRAGWKGPKRRREPRS